MFGLHFHRYRNFGRVNDRKVYDWCGDFKYFIRSYEGRCEVCGIAKIRKRRI